MKKLFLIFAVVLLFCSCSDLNKVRNQGKSMNIIIPAGQKVMQISWNANMQVWLLLEPMDSTYKPKRKIFQGYSDGWGQNPGQIILQEVK